MTNALDTQIGGGHYKDCKIQPIEYMLANNLSYIEGAVVKYVTRWQSKGGIQDLQKAKHLLDILIEHEDQPVCGCGASGVDVDRCVQQHTDNLLPVPCRSGDLSSRGQELWQQRMSESTLPEPLIQRDLFEETS